MERPDLCIFDEGKFESIFIEIPRRGKCSIIVGEVPGTRENDFIEKHERIIKKHKKIIIGTDQNLDYLKIPTHQRTMEFFLSESIE